MAKAAPAPDEPLLVRLQRLLDELAELVPEDVKSLSQLAAELKPVEQKKLLRAVEYAILLLREVEQAVDPVAHPATSFDPSHPSSSAQVSTATLLASAAIPLAELKPFYGSGVYAIFYDGDYDAYRPLVGHRTPIYVGKSSPDDPNATDPKAQGIKLFGRLSEHAKNIGLAENLNLRHFSCRYLVVAGRWATAVEDLLIGRFRPIWNNETGIAFGLGKHGDSAKTRVNKRSPWDTLHPGRKWAKDSPPYDLSVDEIKAQIAEHFKAHPPEK